MLALIYARRQNQLLGFIGRVFLKHIETRTNASFFFTFVLAAPLRAPQTSCEHFQQVHICVVGSYVLAHYVWLSNKKYR